MDKTHPTSWYHCPSGPQRSFPRCGQAWTVRDWHRDERPTWLNPKQAIYLVYKNIKTVWMEQPATSALCNFRRRDVRGSIIRALPISTRDAHVLLSAKLLNLHLYQNQKYQSFIKLKINIKIDRKESSCVVIEYLLFWSSFSEFSFPFLFSLKSSKYQFYKSATLCIVLHNLHVIFNWTLLFLFYFMYCQYRMSVFEIHLKVIITWLDRTNMVK